MKNKLLKNLILSEKLPKCNKQIIIRTQEEIDEFNKCVGYRKARVKRYGKTATQRIKERDEKN